MASEDILQDEEMYTLHDCFSLEDIEEIVGSTLEDIGFPDECDKTIKSLNAQKSQLTRENNQLKRLFMTAQETTEKLAELIKSELEMDGKNQETSTCDYDDNDDEEIQVIVAKVPKHLTNRDKPTVHQQHNTTVDKTISEVASSDIYNTTVDKTISEVAISLSPVKLAAPASADKSSDDIQFTAVIKNSKPVPCKDKDQKYISPFRGMNILGKKGNDIWGKGIIREIKEVKSQRMFKVKFLCKGGEKFLNTKQIAYADYYKEYHPVGTRVVALYRDRDTASSFYAGIVAEPPSVRNTNRFLIFFDDGYAQYCVACDVHKVCEQSRNVWEDIHPDSQEFIRDYLIAYPERPMVRLQEGQIIKTEWNGEWWTCRVVKVDASLVNMYFEADLRYEWIYRGSTRLEPLYTELANAEAAKTSTKSARRHTNPMNKRKRIFVEYTRGEEEAKKSEEAAQPSKLEATTTVNVQKKPVARKSSAAKVKPHIPERRAEPYYGGIYDISNIHTGRNTIRRPYEKHRCNTRCIQDSDDDPSMHKGTNPLLIPIYCGWERQLGKQKGGTSKISVFYRSPCGRRLRSLDELDNYLVITDSLLTIDLFCFEACLQTHREFIPIKTFCDIKDLSYGRENVPISCVNGIDRQYPEYMEYSSDKMPTDGVEINMDPNFLVGCNCTDGCRDRSKCSCAQLTIEASAASYGGKIDPNAGYRNRKLDEQVITGIFECNSKCKCDHRCRNKVVQNGLTLRLQVFKTEGKGWGLRCLDDIPSGGFICTYVGQLYTEQIAIQEGKQYGDEYQAELDFMEVVEKVKEGYESDVDSDEGIGDDDDESNSDSSYSAGSMEPGVPITHRESARQKERAKQKTTEKQEKPATIVLRRDSSSKEKDKEWSVSLKGDQSNETANWVNKLPDPESMSVESDGDSNQSGSRKLSRDHRKETKQSAILNKHGVSRSSALEEIVENKSGKKKPNLEDLSLEDTDTADETRDRSTPMVEGDEVYDSDTFKRASKFRNLPNPKSQAPVTPIRINLSTMEVHKSQSQISNTDKQDREKKDKKAFQPTRSYFGANEMCYIMDAKTVGNIGRYLNHSCSPNVFVQNVFVDTHDLRFPWVAFFAQEYIRAGTELTWDYNYEVGSVPGKTLHCYCGSSDCRGRLL